jgi:outer membrane receptor protein involved in Fe transport
VKKTIRIAIASILCSAGLAHAQTQSATSMNIPAGDLSTALEQVSKQAHVNLVFAAESLRGLKTEGLQGNLTAKEAVQKLLLGTSLELRTDEQTGAMLVVGKDKPTAMASNPNAMRLVDDEDSAAGTGERGTRESELRLAQVSGGNDGTGAGAAQNGESTSKPDCESLTSAKDLSCRDEIRLQEVVVTAQKKEERLRDVPVPVTALSAQTLLNNGQSRLQDYFARVPGLTLTPGLSSAQNLTIRGISPIGGNPSVGVMIDDVPYGSSSVLGGSSAVPDIDPNDLERIEVLRGPQGTLYGASSMGGLLKFVTRDPSTERVAGDAQLGTSSVYNGTPLGYSMRGSVNVPLSDMVAVRASAFTRQDPGYIDNPVAGKEGVNRAKANGGRLSALWRPSDVFSVKLSALLQEISADGASVAQPLSGLGDLAQNQLLGTGAYERRSQAYSATLNGKIGSVDLTAVSGYNINAFKDSTDFTLALGGATQALLGVKGTATFNDNQTRKFTQEVRLDMPFGERFDWLLGGYYTDEDTRYIQTRRGIDETTGALVGDLRRVSFPTTYKEYAAFTDLTWKFTDRFDIQFGGRQSEIRQTITQTATGIAVAGGIAVIPTLRPTASSFTYLVTPRFRLSPDLMLYARLASGYRAGGANLSFNAADPAGAPLQYDPDKTQNYELGMKSTFMNGALSIDASLYQIDWKDIQLLVFGPGNLFTYTTNASRAKSQGAELSMDANSSRGLSVSAWVVFNDARLTEALPPTAVGAYGPSGTQLPGNRFSANFSLRQTFSIAGSLSGSVGTSVSYVGERASTFAASSTAPRVTFPSYAQADVFAGLLYDSWEGNFYINNVADKRAILSDYTFPPNSYFYIQPRTIGVTLSKMF